MFDPLTSIDIDRLSAEERLDLIGRLWDRLGANDVGLTPAQTAELNRRLAMLDEDIEAGSTWEEVEAELDRRHP